MLNGAGVTRPT